MAHLRMAPSDIPNRVSADGSQKANRYHSCLTINPQSIISYKKQDNNSNANEIDFSDNVSRLSCGDNYDSLSTYNDMST